MVVWKINTSQKLKTKLSTKAMTYLKGKIQLFHPFKKLQVVSILLIAIKVHAKHSTIDKSQIFSG